MNGHPEPLLPDFLVTPMWLRQCFALADSSVRHGVEDEPDIPVDRHPPLTPAAVLVPLINHEAGLTILFTQRTAHLRDHANQISFPGGRCEKSDGSPVETALREAREEIGLNPAQVEVLGRLPEYRTATGFSIVPIVALVRPPLFLQLENSEVAEAFESPLNHFLNPANHQRHCVEYQGSLREYYAIPWQGHFIWGATAGMLVSLQRFLSFQA